MIEWLELTEVIILLALVILFLCGIGNRKDQVSIYTGERDHSKKEKKDESNSTGILWQW